MLSFKLIGARCVAPRALKACTFLRCNSTTSSTAIKELLNSNYFVNIKDKDQLTALEPYEFTLKLNQTLKECDPKMTKDIYNLLIENLTRFDYAVSSISQRSLESSNQKMTIESLIELIKYNPGRRLPTWELFKENLDTIFQDVDKSGSKIECLKKVLLRKLIDLDPIELEEEKHMPDSKDLTRIVFLIQNMSDASLSNLDSNIFDKVCRYLLETNSSVLLGPFLSRIQTITNYKMSDFLNDFVTTDLQKSYVSLHKFVKEPNNYVIIHELVDLINKNQNDSVTFSIQEEKPTELIKEETLSLNSLSKFLPNKLDIKENLNLFQVFNEKLVPKINFEKDLELLGKVMRNVGSISGNMTQSMKLYDDNIEYHKNSSDTLKFERFLSKVIRSYEKNDAELYKQCKINIPKLENNLVLENKVLRSLIILNSKFNIDESLTLFNENITKFKTDLNPQETGLSLAGHLSESLILAYLSKKDRDFAHVIYEGSVRENIISGQTAIKSVKGLLSYYGDIIELSDQEFKESIDQKIITYLKSV